ncbi:MAG TPA: DUF3326 domain-containing protein [Pyrinomonadaceae bacterium]|jgi:hypothetical protein
MIKNRQHKINRSEIEEAGSLASAIERLVGRHAIRWYIAQVTQDEMVVEATTYGGELAQFNDHVGGRYYSGRSVAINIIPTGVGCEIGGYAGDAAPVTNLLASTVDYLVTNPNAVNASNFISMDDNVLYTEGRCIDLFCQGLVDLYPTNSNKVGLIIEKSDSHELEIIFNVINAVRAIHGVEVVDYVLTDRAIGSRCVKNDSGAYVGAVDNPSVIFEACDKLVKMGANAIAITTNIQDLPLEDYAKHFAGQDPNPLGGVEAIISHLITNQFQVPAAHAPLLNFKELDLTHNVVDARGAGEMASASGLACVLIGLRRAPQIGAKPNRRIRDAVNINNLLAVVTPASCLGGVPAIYAHKYGIPIIAVQENRTVLDVTQQKIGLSNVLEVRNYAEATGVLMALRKGVSLESIARPFKTFRY